MRCGRYSVTSLGLPQIFHRQVLVYLHIYDDLLRVLVGYAAGWIVESCWWVTTLRLHVGPSQRNDLC
jgi:hypothetical protein